MKPVYKQFIGKDVVGESFREIGVLLRRPQLNVVNTMEIPKISCLSRKNLLNILWDNPEDEWIIIIHLVQVCVKGYKKIMRHTTMNVCRDNIEDEHWSIHSTT